MDRHLLAAVLLGLSLVAGCVAVPIGGQVDGSPTTAPDASGTADGADLAAQRGTPADPPGYTRLYRETIGSVAMLQVDTPAGVVGGSGFVYDRRGHLVTNEHVVGDATTVDVRFRDGEWRTGTVVGTDAYSDLAVVHVADPPAYASPLPIAEDPPRPGERVVALGSPFGLEGSITAGIVSGVNRTMPTENRFSIPDTVQTDAAVNPGNSGGPLVSLDGRVVGVNRATSGDNVGFAISAAIVERVVPALVERGRYDHAYLGIASVEVTPAIAEANDLGRARGLLVVETPAGGPAADVLEPATSEVTVGDRALPVGGDVVVAVDGVPVDTHEGLARHLALSTRPGQTVTVTVVRDGTRRTLDVTLGTRPPT